MDNLELVSILEVAVFGLAIAQMLLIILTVRRERDIKELRDLVEEREHLRQGHAHHDQVLHLGVLVELHRPHARLRQAVLQAPRHAGHEVLAADTDEEARLLFTSLQQAFVNLRTGRPAPLPPPLAGYEDQIEPRLADMLASVLRCAIVGGPAAIAEGLSSFIAAHKPDEIMVTAQIFDAAARRKSYDILSRIHAPSGT